MKQLSRQPSRYIQTRLKQQPDRLYSVRKAAGWSASDYSEKLRRFAALNQTGFSYALSGDDAGRLTIDTDTGFISAVTDYENAQDADRNQRYEVDVIYSDGTIPSQRPSPLESQMR